ncbi:hypothetical protein Q7P35_006127 [Cladosporium inversicolor]
MPSFASRKSAVVQQTIDQQNVDLFCFCRQPDDGNYMICCGSCDGWFHGACVGIDEENEPEQYLCSDCENSGNVDHAGQQPHDHHHDDDDGYHHQEESEEEDSDEGDDEEEEDDEEERYDAETAERDEIRGLLGLDISEDDLASESESESETWVEPPRKRARGRRAETPVLRQVQKRRRPTKRILLHLDPSAYKNLDLGTDGAPEWWVKAGHANDQPIYDRGRRQLVECLQKRIDQAKRFSLKSFDHKRCPLRRDILGILQGKTWTAEKLADVFLGGMCPYRQWLMGLDRPPTAEEIRGIPRATSEQLANFGVYTDLVTNESREYMYTGSGTSQRGVGSRWRTGYECPIGSIRSGKKPAPVFRESHVSVLLQPNAQASIRLRASWNAQTISPTLVVMMEAALIDFEDTMSDAVPEDVPAAERMTDSFADWERRHSRPMREDCRAAYPSGRARSMAIGLNRASPYKQGAYTGILNHRSRVMVTLDSKCPCCAKERKHKTSGGNTRLSTEVSFPLLEIPLLCHTCWLSWEAVSDKSGDGAREFCKARRKSSREMPVERKSISPTLGRGQCFACKEDADKRWTGYLPSHPEEGLCTLCRDDWGKNNKRPDKAKKGFHTRLVEAAWLAIRSGPAIREARKVDRSANNAAPRDSSGQCFVCQKHAEARRQTIRLANNPGAMVCDPCSRHHSEVVLTGLLDEDEWIGHRRAGTWTAAVRAAKVGTPSGQCFACHKEVDKRRSSKKFPSNPGAMICDPCSVAHRRYVAAGHIDVDEWLAGRRTGTANVIVRRAKAAAKAKGKGKRKADDDYESD